MHPYPNGVLILHNVPRTVSSFEGAFSRVESDASVLDQVEAVAAALKRLRIPYSVAGVRRLRDVADTLQESAAEVVFNLVESLLDDPADFNLVPALCRTYGKGCTGNGTEGLMTTLDKWQTKCLLRAADLPCPEGALVPVGKRIPFKSLPQGALIVKPALSDGSEGIDAGSVLRDSSAGLDVAVRRIHELFRQPALVEQFVGHRELNVSLLERNGKVEVMPAAEIDFAAFGEDRPRIVGYSAKWLAETFEFQNTPRTIPAPITERQAERVRRAAVGAWRVLGCRDYVRVDFRMDRRGRVYILEVNMNPDISPEGGFAAAIAAAGIPYEEFVEAVLRNAASRLPDRLQTEPAASHS